MHTKAPETEKRNVKEKQFHSGKHDDLIYKPLKRSMTNMTQQCTFTAQKANLILSILILLPLGISIS